MSYFAEHSYVHRMGEDFFTVVLLPYEGGQFPKVIMRTPYANHAIHLKEEEIVAACLDTYKIWLDRGYAVVFQHCRGQGKSTGAFVPYIHEREDSLALFQWVRSRPFYNGELFLRGGSYGASLFYVTAPFACDIKGAVLEVQDSERYRLWYRNGQMRKGHANWHFNLYKNKCGLNKTHSMASFSQNPLRGLSQRVLGDHAEDFEQMLQAQHPEDAFWSTGFGGIEAKNATDDANIPILFTTGYNDFYIGGVFKMWNRLGEETKSKCALLVSPYNHGDSYGETDGLAFPGGKRTEEFGSTYAIDWFDNIRKGSPLPYKKGEITYYRAFENRWQGDFYGKATQPLQIPLGTDAVSFVYDPLDPPEFSAEGTFLKSFENRRDVITIDTPPLDKDVFVKGQMKAVLTVSSNCPDTAFYICISIKKPQGDYVLRHDITSLGYRFGKYRPNSRVVLEFCFDEHAFLLKKGESLGVHIASADNNTYVCHTNRAGPYDLQRGTTVATNTVDLGNSALILPLEV